jgi:glycosyltransferase involved in cell wall biosynthesis
MGVNVAVIIGSFPQWSERFILRETAELLRRGIQVTIFALRRGTISFHGDPEIGPLCSRVQLLPRTLTAAVLHLGNPPLGEQRSAVRRELGLAGLARSMKSRSLVRALRQGGFTHVHAHFANWPSTLGWLAARETGLPFTFSAHARDLFVEPQLLEEKAADAIAFFACHRRAYEQLRQLAGGSRAVLMHHGLPLEAYPFCGTQPPARKGRPARLVCAGRFVPKKGLADILTALAHKELRSRAIELTLVGAGDQRRELEGVVAHHNLADRVRFSAPESSVDLVERLRSADLLVAPCRKADDGDHDGVPNVLLEAFALGLPVVGTDAGSLPEVLTPQTGFVAPSDDPAGLAGAVAEALDREEEAALRARAARAWIEAHHNIRTAIVPLLRVLGVE